MKKLFKVAAVLPCSFFIVFGAIFFGVFFGIFFPFVRDFNQASCRILQTNYLEAGGDWENTVILYTVNVLHEGKNYTGFACEADSYNFLTSVPDSVDYYAYQYADCAKFSKYSYNCKTDEEIPPRWYCSEKNSIKNEEEIHCYFGIANSIYTDISESSPVEYPKIGVNYIFVMLDDEVHYSESEFWALIIVDFVLLTFIPMIISFIIIARKIMKNRKK